MQNQTKIFIVAIVLAAFLAAAIGAAAYFRVIAEELRHDNETALVKLRTLERKLEELQIASGESTSVAITTPRGRGASATDQEQLATLQTRVAELEGALLERDRVIASLQSSSTNRVSRGFGQPGGQGRERGSWLEDLRRTDPQRYEEITKAREEIRQRVSEGFAKKATHFLTQDVKNMNEEQKAQYERLIQLLNESWALTERLQADLPSEERRNIYGTLWQNMAELGPLLEAERQREFMDLALRVGYKPDEAQEFVAYVNQILDATSLLSLFPGMRGGPFGFGFRGEGRGPRRQRNSDAALSEARAGR